MASTLPCPRHPPSLSASLLAWLTAGSLAIPHCPLAKNLETWLSSLYSPYASRLPPFFLFFFFVIFVGTLIIIQLLQARSDEKCKNILYIVLWSASLIHCTELRCLPKCYQQKVKSGCKISFSSCFRGVWPDTRNYSQKRQHRY